MKNVTLLLMIALMSVACADRNGKFKALTFSDEEQVAQEKTESFEEAEKAIVLKEQEGFESTEYSCLTIVFDEAVGPECVVQYTKSGTLKVINDRYYGGMYLMPDLESLSKINTRRFDEMPGVLAVGDVKLNEMSEILISELYAGQVILVKAITVEGATSIEVALLVEQANDQQVEFRYILNPLSKKVVLNKAADQEVSTDGSGDIETDGSGGIESDGSGEIESDGSGAEAKEKNFFDHREANGKEV